MKKRLAIILSAACLLTGCVGNKTIKTGNKPLANAVYNNDSVSLAPYTGLKAEKKIYDVSDEAVEQQIQENLREFAEYKSANRASRNGDFVYTDYTASIDGSISEQEDSYYFTLGEAEYGTEFDEKLTGVSAGDQLNFSIAFGEDAPNSEWEGKTVDFEIDVTDVQIEILPDADDAFIKENTKYENYEAFASAARQTVADSYAADSDNELKENLIDQVISASSILQYTKEEYNTAKDDMENMYMGYVDMFGTDLESLYETLDMTEQEIEEEIQSLLYRTLVIDAIIESENLSLSEKDYEDGIAYYMKENDYDSKEEFMEAYVEEEVRGQLTEDMVLNFLKEHADITEVKAVHEDS